jgi:hypothetical protein
VVEEGSMNRYVLVLMLGMLLLLGCSPGQPAEDVAQRAAATGTQKEPTEEIMKADGDNFAEVISVQVSGSEGAYQFSVQVSSPDTGCDQYADWWEVVTDQGELVYRRVLLQAHMNTVGYGGQALKGSVQNGFEPAELSPDFATDLAEQPPLPEGCAF